MTEAAPSPEPLDEDALVASLRQANVPALLAVTYQLTGDRSWLADRFRPSRAKGMDENRDGGLPPEVQDEVRRGAADAILAWSRGREVALPTLAGPDLVEVLTFVNGEDVPAEYEAMMSELLYPQAARDAAPEAADGDLSDGDLAALAERDLSVLVVGAGVSGLLLSLRLREAGIRHTVVEKNSEVGGGWWENSYPGSGVDTPSYLYSYSFFPRDWGTFFGKRDEVLQYLRDFADAHDVRRHVQFRTEVVSLELDEETSRWTARVRRGDGTADTIEADVVVSAVGVLNRPKIPDLPGLDSFGGDLFHSARWPKGLDLAGKRVGIVGAGASAMQIAPAIAERTGSLTIFQRSPQWIAPNDDYFEPVDAGVHWLVEHVPFYSGWYRAKLSWIFNDRVHPTLKVDPEWGGRNNAINVVNDGHRRFYTRYIQDQLGDRADLIEKSTPDYPPFGKRMLLDNGWYAMLRRPNVELVTEGVVSVDETGVVDTAGDHHDLDVVVLATGFQSSRYLHPMRVVGRGGRELTDVWGEHDVAAYLGMTVPGFPNLFIACGPNTGTGHGGSFITIAEWQVRYVVEALTRMVEQDAAAVEVRDDVYRAHVEAVDAAHAELVWTDPRMTNWYRNEGGRVVAVMPWRIVDYYEMTRHVDADDYTWTPREPADASADDVREPEAVRS